MRDNIYLQLIAVFAPLSLLSIGGGQSVIADINQQAVAIHGWMTQREFIDLFAISRAAPGPGSLLATLIGWKEADWAGAVVASLALFCRRRCLRSRQRTSGAGTIAIHGISVFKRDSRQLRQDSSWLAR